MGLWCLHMYGQSNIYKFDYQSNQHSLSSIDSILIIALNMIQPEQQVTFTLVINQK
jgi:hypothetical protein